MAGTSVLKLKVDGNEYDAGLKKAQSGLQALEKSLRDAGKSFSDVDKQVVEYVRAIGQMDTTAKTSRGALRDMTQTLTDLTLQYRALTDEEKKSPFGEALSQSLADLTQRASDINDAMGDVSQSISNAASDTRTFDQVAGGFSFMVSGLQTAQGAAKLLGIEFGNDIEIIAKLQAAMAVTSGLQQIQNMLQKQSALMQGIIALQTRFNFLAKMNPYALLATGAAVLVTSLVALTSKEDEQVKKMEEARKAAEDLKNEWDKISNNTAGALYGKFITLQASWEKLQTVGEKTQWIKNNTSAFSELGVSIKSISNAEDVFVNNTDKMIKSIELRARAAVLQKQIEKSLEDGIKDENGLYTLGYAVSQNLAKELAEIQSELQGLMGTASVAINGGGGGKNTSQAVIAPQYSVAGLTEDLRYLQQEQQKATNTEEWRTYADAIRAVDDEIKKIKGELSSLGTANASGISISAILSGDAAAAQESFRKQKLEPKLVEKKEVKLTEQMGQMVGGINSMVSGIEGLGIELPKGFKDVIGGMQSVISIMSGISSILVAIEAISTADTIIPFHTGGVVRAARGYRVPGNYGYDAVPAILTSGETVLTRAQAGNLASQLAERNSGMVMQPYVEGEKIFLGMNNTSKRMGKGEIVTTSMLRQYGLLN